MFIMERIITNGSYSNNEFNTQLYFFELIKCSNYVINFLNSFFFLLVLIFQLWRQILYVTFDICKMRKYFFFPGVLFYS